MAVFYNMATLSYNNTSVNSNIVSGEIRSQLNMTKNALSEYYTPGGTVTYVIGIVNPGNTAYSGVTLTDDLGAYTVGDRTFVPLDYVQGSLAYYVNGELTTTPVVNAGPPLVISGVDIPANGNVVIIYQAVANEFASPAADGEITNTVTASGACIGALSASETVTVQDSPRLIISKSLNPVIVEPNGRITYTFVISNLSAIPAVATDNLTVTDNFDPVLSDIVVTLNGEELTEPGEYTYDEASGAFATALSLITVPGATVVQNPETGEWTVTPGTAVLTVSGNI